VLYFILEKNYNEKIYNFFALVLATIKNLEAITSATQRREAIQFCGMVTNYYLLTSNIFYVYYLKGQNLIDNSTVYIRDLDKFNLVMVV
jgi:hypothetical protein